MPEEIDQSATGLYQKAKVILIVEDDEDVGEFLVAAIQQETPFHPILVRDGFAAFKTVHDMKPDLFILDYSVVLFGYLLKPLGLVLATGALIFGSAWGGHEFKVKEVTILFVALAIFAVYAFVKGLGLPMNIWPAFLD